MEQNNTNKDAQLLKYLDNKEYQAKFLLDPDLSQEIDYQHLDKNLAITNLEYNPKLKIDEAEQARSILRGLHVLNNPKHYKEVEEEILIGYKEEIKQEEGQKKVIQIPVYRKQKKMKPKFEKTYHALKSEFLSFINTSAARKGHRIKAAITNRLVKEETIQDKTNVNSRWGFKK